MNPFPSASSLPTRDEIEYLLTLVSTEAQRYLKTVDDRPARSPNGEAALVPFHETLPEAGAGSLETLRRLLELGVDAAVTSAGPRCYHFVMGGTTPAALAADWVASAWDQIAYAWASSPLAVEVERLAIDWLRDLFALPERLKGLMTTGATMANFVGLTAARQWWGEQQGIDVSEVGLSGLPTLPVLTSGYLHASTRKALAMLGVGRGAVKVFARDEIGHVDLEALEAALVALNGAPALLVANAGEVNAGDFDPVEAFAELAERHGAWLHVDGAFGLFARLSPRTEHLTAGVERADSVTVDGHKWLNVPYDCGFSFVRDENLLRRAFAYSADYLPTEEDPRPNFGAIGPESSRRARAFSVWATLRAYGRRGHRELVERHLDLTQHLARLVDEAEDLERLAEVPLNIVCFRFNPGGLSEEELDGINARLGERLLEDGRYWAGPTRYGGRAALRPALVNWRIRETDLDGFVEVVRELGKSCLK